MRNDTIFYQLFQTFPTLLFELIGQPPSDAQVYNFTSREIKELARRFDGIFEPSSDSSPNPIYFVEVQFKSKSDFYWRLFGEIFVYLMQYQPKQDWVAVAVFASRSVDAGVPMQYWGLLTTNQVKFVYLDELGETASPSLGFGIVQLVVGNQETAVEQTNRLMQQARQLEDVAFRQKVLELIETTLVYKFTTLSRQELEAMFGLDDLKQTRYFREVAEDYKQEGKQEGKLLAVPLLLQAGFSVEEIAQRLELDVEVVRQAAQTPAADTPERENTGS